MGLQLSELDKLSGCLSKVQLFQFDISLFVVSCAELQWRSCKTKRTFSPKNDVTLEDMCNSDS